MNQVYFRSKIKKVQNGKIHNTDIEIIYQIVSIDNRYFFAREIFTQKLFPIFTTVRQNFNTMFKEYSYLKMGTYFIYHPIIEGSDTLEYFLSDAHIPSKEISLPTKEDVDYYLNSRGPYLNSKIASYANENEYLCPLAIIERQVTACTKDKIDEKVSPLSKGRKIFGLGDITELGFDMSKSGDLHDIVGREEEIEKIIKTVAIKGKSIILLGEPGAGKTALVEKLAYDIKRRQNPWLNGKMIFSLSTAALVSGTKYRGEFEDKLVSLINYCRQNRGQVIIFIDEIHTLYRLGGTDKAPIDALNILKPYLSSGDITIIGATTYGEYQASLVNDQAFLRRVETIDIPLLNRNQMINVIFAYIALLETKYQIKLTIPQEELLEIVTYLIDITDIKNQKVIGRGKITNPTFAKNLIENAFVDAVYHRDKSVTLTNIIAAIDDTFELSPALRKSATDYLEELSETFNESLYLTEKIAEPESRPITLTRSRGGI